MVQPAHTQTSADVSRRLASLRARRRELQERHAEAVQARLQASWAKRVQFGPRGDGKALLSWVKLTHPGYQAGRFHLEVCRHAEQFILDVRTKKSPHVMLFAPPRHGKTAITTQRTPGAAMGWHPGLEVICASYGQDLANDNSRTARSIMRGPDASDVWPGILPTKPQKRHATDYQPFNVDQISHWATGNGSSYKAVGVGGPVTGRGAEMIFVDDPVKGAAEVRSQTKRDALYAWYGSDLYTRLGPGGGVWLMNTRWHVDDLAGRLLAEQGTVEEGGLWKVLSYPAIAEDDSDWREPGEALHPERWPLDALELKRATMGEARFAALYQQRPVPAEGGMFKREMFVERWSDDVFRIAAECDTIYITSDAAKKGGAGNDFHSIQVWGRKGARWFLLDRACDRMEYPAYEQAMDGVWAKWGQWVVRTGGFFQVEDAANGTTYIQFRQRTIPCLVGWNPSSDRPGKDKSKEAQAVYLQRPAQAGQVILPNALECPWVNDWLETVLSFPFGANDDDVDASSQLMCKIAKEENSGDGDSWLMRSLGL